MMNIQIDILGDPAYICQDTFVPVLDSESKAIAGGVQRSTIDREEFIEQTVRGRVQEELILKMIF